MGLVVLRRPESPYSQKDKMRLRNWKETVEPTIEDTLRDVHPWTLDEPFHYYAEVRSSKSLFVIPKSNFVSMVPIVGSSTKGNGDIVLSRLDTVASMGLNEEKMQVQSSSHPFLSDKGVQRYREG
jgi:hypothetical protein